MIKLTLKSATEFGEYQFDCECIVRIFKDRGYEITIEDAYTAWREFSESMCAGWMMLDDDDDCVFQNIYFRFLRDENSENDDG